MNSTADFHTRPHRGGAIRSALRRADAWLDARGTWAWIAAMVAGFVIFAPLGLVILAWMIWGKQMFGKTCRHRGHSFGHGMHRHTGNAAFDSYKADTLRRLEEEQDAFESFLRRLRDARDKQEFDHFMEERARDVATAPTGDETPAGDEPRRGEH
ncbi:DUF2852 domain-containing protein [Pseudogemmobacter humi]|uniref:DUF2852 domain-containing protein n=1 Tax=Pseudogemmobacter humi TaxID=2483812 RepID=A0A3P5XA72_9RHOB|nr:DUF2852 domain-containing protein [Pseudogemmobacter humi]VDC31621.1 hypothetical protein XINFAN_03002 [Pseudogemmobacter humi]